MRYAQLPKKAAKNFVADGALTLAAAVAFYTALSFAPLVILLITVGGFLGDSTQNELLKFFETQMGPQASRVADNVVENATQQARAGASWRWILSIGVLLFTASAVFAQLQSALNRVWGVEAKPGQHVWGWLRKRLVSLGMIVTLFVILLVALVISSVLDRFVNADSAAIARVISTLVSTLVFTLVFAAAYKILPDVQVAWKDVWVGALITAILFAVGEYVISLYLQRGNITRSYDEASGAFLALLVWVYYSAIIFFFGAEMTQQYAQLAHSSMEPTRHARRVAKAPQSVPAGKPAAAAG